MIIDQHQPVVESYYGTGKTASVIARLLQEGDRVCKGLIEGWEEEWAMKRKAGANADSSIVSRLNGCSLQMWQMSTSRRSRLHRPHRGGRRRRPFRKR